MLDLEFVRRSPEEVTEGLRRRGTEVDLTPILDLDKRRRGLVARADAIRSERNRIGEEVGRLRRAKADSVEAERAAIALREELAEVEPDLQQTEQRLRDLMLELPNLPDPRVPSGGEENNQVMRVWGERGERALVEDHVEISTRLGLVDYERGAKLGGRGFWLYRGMGAQLEWALLNHFVAAALSHGYEFLLPPHLLLDSAGYAAGQFPKFRDDVFHLDTSSGERARFLLPTAETAILSVYGDEILDADQLPLKSFAYTPCYRREAGSHRTEERGTVRGHQFNKVELFQFVTPEQSEAALAELVEQAERIVRGLGLHHRVSLLAAGDASASMTITYDIEVWIPSMQTYKEVSSASMAGDYQARRANIRWRRPGSRRTEFVHTLNASALATSRLVPALLEQHLQADGSVLIPEPLQPLLGTDRIV